MTNEELVKLAIDNLKNSYSPYSLFPVSAIVVTSDNQIFKGVNIENAAYGATNCAERSALFAAYSQGYRKTDIDKLIVVSNLEEPISPCGICRQVISELVSAKTEIILATHSGDYQKVTTKELLPFAFTEEELQNEEKRRENEIQ